MEYSVIYADPPWKQQAGRAIAKYTVKDDGSQVAFAGEKSGSRKLEYPQMSVQEICNLDVPSIAAADAHLYIWATNKYLPEVFKVIEAWGFTYKAAIVWAKNMMGGGLGGDVKINTEYLMFAKKGKLATKQPIPASWHNVKRDYTNGAPKHSSKPHYFRQLIKRTSPGRSLEMFAREKRAGWDSWGNEINSDLVINNINAWENL